MKKRKSLTDGMGKIDDSVLERYDKIDAELETKKAAMARKRKFAVISTVSVAAALVLLMMPFALKNLLGLIPIGPDESTVDPPPLVSPSESTTEQSTPEDSTPIESTPAESPPEAVTPNEPTTSEVPPEESTPSDTGTDIIPETSTEPDEPPTFEVSVEFIELGGYYSELFGYAPGEIYLNSEYIEVRTVKDKDYFYAKKAGSFNVDTSVNIPGEVYYISSYLSVVEPGDPNFDGLTIKKGEDVDLTPEPEDIFELKLGDDGDSYTVVSYLGNDTEVVIPEMVNGIYVTRIGGEAFKNDENITSVTLPDSIVSIGDKAFMSCTQLESINLPEGLIELGKEAFENCYKLNSINIPSGIACINEKVFSYSGLESITIPDSVTKISYAAFSNCASLKNVIIGKGVKEIADSAFWKCSSLASIIIPDGITELGNGVFWKCTALSEIVIPESVTRLGVGIFENCESLERAVIPGSVNKIYRRMFKNCHKLKSVTLGEGITEIEYEVFYGCASLENIALPNSLETLGYGAFEKCSLLESISLPEGLERIEYSTFYMCDKLSEAVIPSTVNYISNAAFSSCKELVKINIPAGVTDIENLAFGGCSKLRYLIYEGSGEEWEAVRKEEFWNKYSDLLKVYTDGELPPTVTISYDLGGGVNDPRNPESVYEYESILCVYDAAQEGKVFFGWTWEGQTTPVKNPSVSDITAPITLTANWGFGEGKHAEVYSIARFTPLIDGNLDAEYKYSTKVSLRDNGPECATGTAYFLWDDGALYFYITVNDLTPQGSSTALYEEYQSLDIMMSLARFDPTADNIPAKLAEDIGDAQFTIYSNNLLSDCKTVVDSEIKYSDGSRGGFGKWVYDNTDWNDPKNGSNYMVHTFDDNGFTAEGFIKWSPELKEIISRKGHIIGIGLQYNDDINDDGRRDKKCYSENAGPDSMSMSGNRATCGKFVLGGSIGNFKYIDLIEERPIVVGGYYRELLGLTPEIIDESDLDPQYMEIVTEGEVKYFHPKAAGTYKTMWKINNTVHMGYTGTVIISGHITIIEDDPENAGNININYGEDAPLILRMLDSVCREQLTFDDGSEFVGVSRYYGEINAGHVFEMVVNHTSYWGGSSLVIGNYMFSGFGGPTDGNYLCIYDGENIIAASVAYNEGLISDEELEFIYRTWEAFEERE